MSQLAHTCIKDDGGTPDRRCYACEHEQRVLAAYTGRCCTGINGSHTQVCRSGAAQDDRILCWCCGGEFPARWVALWSALGSRCLQCETHRQEFGCRSRVGMWLDKGD